MKTLTQFFVLLFAVITVYGQTGEFQIYSNGFIYDDSTMKDLNHIVDSLNLKFKTCEWGKKFYSKSQAKGHFVYIKGNCSDIVADVKNNISLDDFLKKYPSAEIDRDLLVIKYLYTDYKNEKIAEFSTIELNGKHEYEISLPDNLDLHSQRVKDSWIYIHEEKTEYTSEYFRAFYFVTDFESKPLPPMYNEMVQYTDCIIDTNTQIFTEKATSSSRWGRETNKSIEEFRKYINKETQKPVQPKEYWNDTIYLKKYDMWDSLRFGIIETRLINEKEFQSLLKKAVDDAIESGGSDEEFEEYVLKYYSKKAVLELKRGRRVIGMCSMDDSPRYHAVNIAVLSAETRNWPTFLRSHLDVMNDRFDRMSDGSYAWGARKTYIKELEELEINVIDLLLGITIRIENPSKNHYFGSIIRIGRSLSESNTPLQVEEKILSAIKDTTLDDYNRLLFYYLYLNYTYYTEDENKKKVLEEKLMAAVKHLPEYITSKLDKN